MPTGSVSLTSNSTTTSNYLMLSYQSGHPATVAATMPSTTGGVDFTIQVAMQDPQTLGSSVVPWFNVGSSGIGTHFSSQNLDPGGKGPVITLAGPVCAVRLQSTAISSGPLTLYMVQGEG